jgi:hypothetical protein
LVDVDELKTQFLDFEFDVAALEIDAQAAAKVARVSGETRAEFLDPEHPDFQAPPAYIGSIVSGRHLPIDFPNLGGIPMDGGKAVACHHPVRAGVPLTGRTHLHEIYDKSGRSGRMVFFVNRMEFTDAQGTHLGSADTSTVIREKPTEEDQA